MKLYPKKLSDIKSLEKEKARLLRKKGKLEQGNILLSGILSSSGNKGGKDDDDDTAAGSGNELFALAEPLIQIARDIVIARLTKKSAPAEKENEPAVSQKKKNSILKRMAFEFIGGYLKWKAIELGFKGLRRLLRARAIKKSASQ